MAASTLFFVLIGIGVASANLMKVVEWLDTPHDASRRNRQPDAAVDVWNDVACQRAELALEAARYAA